MAVAREKPLGVLLRRTSDMAPPRPAKEISSDFVEHTRGFWSGRTGEQVFSEDAREAIRNVSALFDLLATWDQEFHPTPTQLED